MRRIRILAGLLLCAACGRGQKDKQANEGTRTSGKTTVSAQPRAHKPVYPQDDALSILRELNAGAIVTARVARDVSQNDEVLRYAAVVAKDHSDLMMLIDSMHLPERHNLISGTIQREADSTVKRLSNLPVGFNNSFIDSQVRDHQRMLLLLDTAVIPSITDAKLKQLMSDVRPTLAAHLQRAMQIYSERKKLADERHEPFIPAAPAAKPAVPKPQEPQATDYKPVLPDTTPKTTTSGM